eukprot:TRINITY_DN71_c0_g1_i1.p1 TRINITY_DN71_c0_g1~~TRINITY_DN71_c0_g1_i1.p1  ORF type:complete len:395 (-),score=31.21 TRINITY_DN71_c0_g1_i1:64-1095(-)
MWQPDETVTLCNLCQNSFSLLLRKHHCRSCGKIFCDRCSSSRVRLPHLGYPEPVRICTPCNRRRRFPKSVPDSVQIQIVIKEDWENLITTQMRSNRLKRKVRNGIPNDLRPTIWPALVEANELIENNRGAYSKYFNIENTEATKRINFDVPRTFPKHSMFSKEGQGRVPLFNILKAYANYDPEIGYCQGMSYIVAVLLMHLSEELSFWVFVRLMRDYSIRTMFQSHMPLSVQNYEKFLFSKCPVLYNHLKNQNVSLAMFVAPWFKTLFSQQFNLSFVFCLWDNFLLDGLNFIFKVPLSMLIFCKEKLLQLRYPDILFFLRSLPENQTDTVSLIKIAQKMQLET